MSENSQVVQLAYQTVERKDFRDQRGLLVALGMLLLAGATGISGVGVLSILMRLVDRGIPPIDIQNLVSAMVFGAGLTVLWMLTYGALRLRRWIRPMVLLLSVFVVCSCIVPIIGAVAGLQGVKSGMLGFGLVLSIVMMLPPLVVAGVMFAYFNSVHVKRTLEYHDPQARWTDRYPLPVLAITLATGILSLICAAMWFAPALPFFGRLVSGQPQTVLLLILGFIFAVSTLLQFHRRMEGLLIACSTLLLLQISIIYSAFALPIPRIASAMGATGIDLEIVTASAISNPAFVSAVTSLYTVFCLGYAFLNRHYFHQVPGEQEFIAG